MLRSIEQLYGHTLNALDGEIGQVKSFYFDDQNWVVRYLIVETGTWLTSRQVLVSPYALGHGFLAGGVSRVNLTRKQIEDSPSLEWHKPVSRRFEEDYYRYYNWPCYWQGDGLRGMGGFPIVELPAKPLSDGQAMVNGPRPERADGHLWRTQTVNGYHIQASDGIIGHVCDFMVDMRNWAIGQLVITTGHRLSGKKVLIPTGTVTRISYEESTVSINLNAKTVEQEPVHHWASAGAGNRRRPTPQSNHSAAHFAPIQL